ncbi:MAG TPA: sodium:calcium antiporter [Caulobacteraceae bacterium]|nr:sodium:calcium antiporter [Caulobacteraceae bacterium]
MHSLPVILALLLGSAALIYVACEFFVNGVEWVGRKLAVGPKATGTILAAFGTALPESVVTFVAVAFGNTAADKDIGVGAAMGGPLVLGTIAYAVVGAALLICKRELPSGWAARSLYRGLSRDQAWFILISVVKLAIGVTAFTFKPWLGLLFLIAYAAYAWNEISGDAEGVEEVDLEPLKLTPKAETPQAWAAIVQTLASLGVIFVASRFFVGQVDALGPYLGLKPQLLSLLISPIATELPETLNAIIWIRQGKVRLALANISGAMMIQATVPTACGLFWTPWVLDAPLIVAGVVTLLSVSVLFMAFWRGWITRRYLALMSLSYVVFAALTAVTS